MKVSCLTGNAARPIVAFVCTVIVSLACNPYTPHAAQEVVPNEATEEVVIRYVAGVAPDFRLPDADGNWLNLASLRGKPVLLVFFAAWCEACSKQVEGVNQALLAFRAEKLTAVGITASSRDHIESVREFAKRTGAAYPLLVSPGDPIKETYDVTHVPKIYLLDPHGVVVLVRDGYTPPAMLQRMIEAGLSRVAGAHAASRDSEVKE